MDKASERRRQCRYLKKSRDGDTRCTAEPAADELAEIELCTRHLADTLTFLRRTTRIKI